MKNSGEILIASRYVTALFDVAAASKQVEAVERELLALGAAVRSDSALADFVVNPLLNRSQQQHIIGGIADKAGVGKLTKAFLLALAGQRRLNLIPEIASQFSKKAEAARGEISAQVVTAAPASAADIEKIAAHLSKAFGKKVNVEASHDASLLGGIVVKVGGMQLDASAAGKLDRLEQTLKVA